MDYCSTCHRTLNGVFVCPGCGAYAPDIAPPAHLVHSAVASVAPTREVWPTHGGAAAGSFDGASLAAAAAFDDAPAAFDDGPAVFDDGAAGPTAPGAPDADEADGLGGAGATADGRAARRRQRERWRKNRRRALAATAVALVGGGLTIAAMPSSRPPAGQTHAAPPPDPSTTPVTPEAPAAVTIPQRPAGPASEGPGTRPSGRVREAGTDDPAPTATGRPPQARTAVAETPAHHDTAPRAVPASPAQTDTGSTGPAVPVEATTPPRTEERPADSGTSLLGGLVSTTPGTDPASTTQVCLVGLCLG
ncbi:hypothetical protein ACGF1Z_15010 [Streptomyces sp. NPDC048018]|uniref:SCO2400 family protein n=1 Tax=Streptomyces sp. NPDC048018 TaxID=3365499 RepID=UPI003714D9EE